MPVPNTDFEDPRLRVHLARAGHNPTDSVVDPLLHLGRWNQVSSEAALPPGRVQSGIVAICLAVGLVPNCSPIRDVLVAGVRCGRVSFRHDVSDEAHIIRPCVTRDNHAFSNRLMLGEHGFNLT